MLLDLIATRIVPYHAQVTEPHLVAQKKQSQQNGTTTATGPPSDGDGAASTTADDKDMLVTIALLDPEARYTVELDEEDPMRGPARLQEIHFAEEDGGGLLSKLDAAKLVWGLRQVRVIFKNYPLNQVRGRRETEGGSKR